jgi:hypothetical protein
MELLNSLFSKKNIGQLILAILFIIFLLSSFSIPYSLAKLIDTKIGVVIIVFILILLICYLNPIVSILAVLVVYELMKRSAVKVGKTNLEDYYPVQEKKWSPFNSHHQFPYTLEQEVVKNMTTQKFNTTYVKPSFSPVLDDTYDAAPISQN